MPVLRTIPRASLLLLTACVNLLGCSARFLATPVPTDAVAVGGNWQFASTASAAGRLPLLSGDLTGTSTAITGTLHSHTASDCVSPTAPIAVTGSADAKHLVTLTGAGLAGGTLSITGTLAFDGKSLTDAAYTVTGGSCAFTAVVPAVATAFSPIDGTYTGGFSDANGQVISIVAPLTQTPSSDSSGNFRLNGSATFAHNPCFSSPVSIANSLVTGGSFNLTYTDSVTMNSVTALGTFSTDGTMLNVTNWVLTGPCGPDNGTGSLSR